MSEEQKERRLELLDHLYNMCRHLIKQDTLENANFFERWNDAQTRFEDDPHWNNDTVVDALQTIIGVYAQEHWHLDTHRYDAPWGVMEESLKTVFGEQDT